MFKKVASIAALVLASSALSAVVPHPTGEDSHLFDSDTLYVGAQFLYYVKDEADSVKVRLHNSQAGYMGELYFVVPGTDSLSYCFRNKNNQGDTTEINLTERFPAEFAAIEDDTTKLYFMYRVYDQRNESDLPLVPEKRLYDLYTGGNDPVNDAPYISEHPNNSPATFGNMRAGAARIMNDDGTPSKVIEFGFEDNTDNDFSDVIFHVEGIEIDVDTGDVKTSDISLEATNYGTTNGFQEFNTLFKLRNNEFNGNPINLSDLSVRYYYSADYDAEDEVMITSADNWATVTPQTLRSETLVRTVDNGDLDSADRYVEVTFTDNAGVLVDSLQVDLKIKKNSSNWEAFDVENDYSYTWELRTYHFIEWDKMTVYQNGVLIWGTEPN